MVSTSVMCRSSKCSDYLAPLIGGPSHDDLAIFIFNRFDKIISIELEWNGMKLSVLKGEEIPDLDLNIDRTDINLKGLYSVYDVWHSKDIGTTAKLLKREIPVHDVAVYRLQKR